MSGRDGIADLLVIGGGGSGLAAAVHARESGLERVVVVEKTARPGGNAWLAVVMLGLGGHTPQAVIEDQALAAAWQDATFTQMMDFGRWTLDHRVVRTFVGTYPTVIAWLEAKGIRFDLNGFDFGGRQFSTLCVRERHGVSRAHDPARGPGFLGSLVVDRLLEDCRRLNVSILPSTSARRIILSKSGKEVHGVLLNGPQGEWAIEARNVLVAAGGFGANRLMMREYFPELYLQDGPINTLCLGSSTGDGLTMAKEIGLRFGSDIDSGVIGPGHHPWSHSIHEALHRPETVWVNRDGERFINESVGGMSGPALNRQPGAVLWALFDHPMMEHFQVHPSPRQRAMGGEGWLRTLEDDLKKEACWKRKTAVVAGSWEELAETIEVDPGTLRATVDRYNAHCARGRDADFAKDPRLLMPLSTPPFYGVLGVRFCHGTSGGVKVNERMEVTGPEGSPVDGLYASGDNTSGWVTDWGLPGTTLAFAFTSGYIAAQSASQRRT